MSLVRVHNFAVSLDGFGTGEPQSLEAPFGHAGERLHGWMFATRFWGEGGSAGKDRVTGAGRGRDGGAVPGGRKSLSFAQVGDGLAKKVCVVAKAVEIDAEFKIMATMPFARAKVEVRDDLPAVGAGVGVQVVVAAGGFRRNEIGFQAARQLGKVVAIEAEGGFQKGAAGERA